MKPLVVITSELPDVAVAILSRECDIVSHPGMARSEDEVITILSEADAAITTLNEPITRAVFEANPNLRVVANYAVGTNNIDLDAAREHGVVVTNTPGVLTDATADLTMALILAVTRRVVEGDRFLRAGNFGGWHPLMLLGTGLQQKQLGVIGFGRIGFAVAKRAHAFGMSIVYHANHDHEEAHLVDARRVGLEELLATSDVVSLHTPLTPETHHMIDAAAFAKMKPSAYLVNTARGPAVDEAALADALERGAIAGAALDVYENEPAVEPRLLTLSNVVLLPHLGSATHEARNAMAATVAKAVMAVIHGQEPPNRVV